MSIYDNKKELLDSLSIKENFLYGDFSNKFTEKRISKRSGGERIINPPKKKLKDIQRTILDVILKQINYLPCVYGLTSQTNIFENAKQHQKNSDKYILLIDIKDFFPSVNVDKVTRLYKKIGFNKENSKILAKLCTFNKCLPQGSPTSCHLASLCMESLDKKIYQYCNHKNTISDKEIDYIETLIKKDGYYLNNKKALLLPGDEKILNNLHIFNNKIIVPHKYIQELTLLFDKYKKNDDQTDYSRFIGKLGFYIFINKHEATKFFEKLRLKMRD